MKNILLMHPPVLFYKIKIYNLLHYELLKRGYTLYVWTTSIQNNSENILFHIITIPMTIGNFIKVIKDFDISIQINILSKEPSILGFYCFTLLYAKVKSMKSIYYGHGFDLSRRENKAKMIIQNAFHGLFDRILLYSNDQKFYMWNRYLKKVYVAKNTLVMRGYEEFKGKSKENIKAKYGIYEKHIVLFTGRISRRKNFPLFFEMFNSYFAGSRAIGFVVIGPGLSAERIKTAPNFHYFGPVYDQPRINELFYISDIFCVPGSLGLAIVEAMYWGLPVLTLDVFHGPEAMYLRNGHNGFILQNMHEIAQTILHLFTNRDLLNSLGANARATIVKEASIERMFAGFYEVLSSLS